MNFLKKSIIFSAAFSLSLTTIAQIPPQPQALYGDGGVSAFYAWSKSIPGKPGELLRTEKIQESQVKLDNASENLRFLYSSTSGRDSKTPIVVSGSIHLPKGTAPKEGWPVVLWGHGTVGVADRCAPSSAGRSYRDIQYLNRWLQEGFAVVATDYEGLGVAGPHLLINVPSLAYSLLDSGRAALKTQLPLNNKFVIVGQSQGGAAAVAASSYSATYAPDLNIKGSIGTGVIYRDPNAPPSSSQLALNPHVVSPSIGYGIYGFLVSQSLNPDLGVEEVYTAKAKQLVEQARFSCLSSFFSDIEYAALTPAESLVATPSEKYRLIQEQQTRNYGYYPTLRINHPVFIGTGANDVTPDARTQLKLVNDLCKAGTTVQGHLYFGLGHSATVNASLKDSVPFAKKVIAGEKIEPICDPQIK